MHLVWTAGVACEYRVSGANGEDPEGASSRKQYESGAIEAVLTRTMQTDFLSNRLLFISAFMSVT